MRFLTPKKPPCLAEDTKPLAPGFSRTHVCGLSTGHATPHHCRKHTCRHEWANRKPGGSEGGAA